MTEGWLTPKSTKMEAPTLGTLRDLSCLHLADHLYLHNKLVPLFPWVLWAILANYWTWGGYENPWFIKQVGQADRQQPWTLIGIWSGEGQSCGTEPLICGACANSRCLVLELNCRIPSWFIDSWRIGWCGKTCTHLVSKVVRKELSFMPLWFS